jgi:creatinine amidohydrolase
MKLQDMTWPEVDAISREVVVLIPTGSLEQHGPHLPLSTDTLLVTAVAEAVEQRLGEAVLLTPTLWLGASAHHLPFAGTLSADFSGYQSAIASIVESLLPHGFHKFYVLNGHGGNDEPNGISLRTLKAKYPDVTLGQASYYGFARDAVAANLRGPRKTLSHACEAETSLVMHIRPDLVRIDKLRDDGLSPEPPAPGVIHNFDEISEQGSIGYATLAAAETGRLIFEAAVEGTTLTIQTIAEGYVLQGLPKA